MSNSQHRLSMENTNKINVCLFFMYLEKNMFQLVFANIVLSNFWFNMKAYDCILQIYAENKQEAATATCIYFLIIFPQHALLPHQPHAALRLLPGGQCLGHPLLPGGHHPAPLHCHHLITQSHLHREEYSVKNAEEKLAKKLKNFFF